MGTYQDLCQDLKQLNGDQLDQVADFIASLLAEAEIEYPSCLGNEDQAPVDLTETNGNGKTANGWTR